MAEEPVTKRPRGEEEPAPPPPPPLAPAPKSDLETHMSSVVLIEVACASPNYLQPWQMHPQESHKGSGFVIDGRRIITNFHVVEDAIDVRLRKHGVARRWRGKVVVGAHDVDLAVVTVHEEEEGNGASFWDGLVPSRFDHTLPLLQSSVHVVGFPTGGTTICVTQGVVSRIDCMNYRLGYTAGHNPGRILVIQIDAAINPGNSGGPAFLADGRVAGIAFQGIGGDTDNIGYIIPSSICRNFLDALEQCGGTYPGIADIPFKHMELRNRSLRDKLRVAAEQTGVAVTKVSPCAPPALSLHEDDVIVAIDGLTVGDDFTVELRRSELVAADYLITCKPRGQPTTFSILRDGAPAELTAVLGALPHVIPRCHGFDCAPTYLLVGGLVFCPLACPMLDDKKHKTRSQALYHLVNFKFVEDFVATPGVETVVLVEILTDSLNYGYDGYRWRVLDKVNGVKIDSMRQLCDVYANFTGRFFEFEFELGGSKIVLAAEQSRAIEAQIQATHAIPSIASTNLAAHLAPRTTTPPA